MRFDDVREALAARGWRCDADGARSPSGGFWFDRPTFDRDIRAVYYPAARRAHSFPDSSDASELKFLVAALNADPALASLNDRLTTVRARLASYADAHAMTISLWAFGYPSVRATARHPSGGVAVVEGVVDDTPSVDLHAYHWVDDHTRSVRLSRRRSFPRLFDSTDLDTALHDALAFLLSSPARTAFESTALGPCRSEHPGQ
jgi:hypothetical protein